MVLTRGSASFGRAMRSGYVMADAIGLFYGPLGVIKLKRALRLLDVMLIGRFA